jgi:hypothetical protein
MSIIEDCAVCWTELRRGQTFTVCGHVFCVSCVNTLTQRGVTTCPLCRANTVAAIVDPEVDLPYPVWCLWDPEVDPTRKPWYIRVPGESAEWFAAQVHRIEQHRLAYLEEHADEVRQVEQDRRARLDERIRLVLQMEQGGGDVLAHNLP